MKLSEKLIKRLRDELHLDIPQDSKFKRWYPGHWQRGAGAWLWSITPKIGSQYTVTELLKCAQLDTYEPAQRNGDIEIVPRD